MQQLNFETYLIAAARCKSYYLSHAPGNSVIRFTDCVLSDGGAHFSKVIDKHDDDDLLAFQVGYSVGKRFGKGCCFLLIDSLMSRRPGWELF